MLTATTVNLKNAAKRARDILSDPSRWTKGRYFVVNNSPGANQTDIQQLLEEGLDCSMCYIGAFWVALRQESVLSSEIGINIDFENRISEIASQSCLVGQDAGGVIQKYNDAPETTHDDIMRFADCMVNAISPEEKITLRLFERS